jgi:hypothetical protein
MTTQQTVITAIKKVLDKGDIECPGSPFERRAAALNAPQAPQTPRSGLERAKGALNLELGEAP